MKNNITRYHFSPKSEFRILLKIMKTCLLFLFVFTLHMMAMDTNAQDAVISLKNNPATVNQLINEIEKQTDYLVIYNSREVDTDRKIDFKKNANKISNYLEEAFSDTDIGYKFKNKYIVLAKKTGENAANIAKLVTIHQQRGKTITGRVTDTDGEPLAGVTIVISGTTRGVITDIDGTFSIDVSPTDKLEFSFVGMEKQVVEVGDKTVLDIEMSELVDELDEVTIVAFGKQKKESVISAIQTVRVSELRVPSSNLTTAFAGRIAGMISYQTSGEPGQDDAQFFIRGITTFGSGKVDPLILIDNVEVTSGDLSRLHPDDIESFSILKDATATTLYGARGANGVVLVTTKHGKEGKINVNVRLENTFSAPTKKIKLADPITYMKMANEAVRTRNPLAPNPYSREKIEMTLQPDTDPYAYPATDWMEMLFEDVTSNQRANLNISGGGESGPVLYCRFGIT